MAAKTKGEPSGRSNRFRMVVIDSDLSDDAIGNLTQAITSALRGTALPATKPVQQRALSNGNGKADAIDVETEDVDTEPVEAANEDFATARSTTPKPPRQYAKPKVLKLELTAGRDVPFQASLRRRPRLPTPSDT